MPLLFIAIIVKCLKRTKLMIDWHNYGYTIMQVNRKNKFFVWIAKM